jgi:hypothetical protein
MAAVAFAGGTLETRLPDDDDDQEHDHAPHSHEDETI